jgi:hypothetical protein
MESSDQFRWLQAGSMDVFDEKKQNSFSNWVSLAALEKKEEFGTHRSGRIRGTWGRVPGASHSN